MGLYEISDCISFVKRTRFIIYVLFSLIVCYEIYCQNEEKGISTSLDERLDSRLFFFFGAEIMLLGLNAGAVVRSGREVIFQANFTCFLIYLQTSKILSKYIFWATSMNTNSTVDDVLT